jgi:hypothetical protein
MTARQQTKNSRRRTGAISWRAWDDASDPGRVLEEFVVASWDDHLRQHERVTKREQAHLERVRELTDPDHPVVVTHWLAVSSRKLPGSPAKPTCLHMTSWSNYGYLAQTAPGNNSHGNTASRALLVPHSLLQLQPHNFYSATTIFAAGTNRAVNAPSVLRMGLQCAYSHPRAS